MPFSQTPTASHEIMLISKRPCKDLFHLLYDCLTGRCSRGLVTRVVQLLSLVPVVYKTIATFRTTMPSIPHLRTSHFLFFIFIF